MTGGPIRALDNPQIQIEETHEQRNAFLRWLYDEEYELPTPAGKLAQQIHRADSLGYHVLRNRCSHAWVRQIGKRRWKIDVELLMRTWHDWKAANANVNVNGECDHD